MEDPGSERAASERRTATNHASTLRIVAVVAILALLLGVAIGAVVAGGGNNSSTAGVSPSVTPAPDSSPTSVAVLPNIPQLIANARQSVVLIDVQIPVQFGPRTTISEATGTGFVFTADGLIVTNAHVVSGAQSISVTLPDGTSLPGTLSGMDESADIALVQVDRTGLVPLPIGSSAGLKAGDFVLALGNALALKGGPTATHGIISALGRTVTVENHTLRNLIQTDAAINEGDSGGPLLNAAGEIIGINTIASTNAENIGFSIPIDDALAVIARLQSGG